MHHLYCAIQKNQLVLLQIFFSFFLNYTKFILGVQISVTLEVHTYAARRILGRPENAAAQEMISLPLERPALTGLSVLHSYTTLIAQYQSTGHPSLFFHVCFGLTHTTRCYPQIHAQYILIFD
jgi:hypothetical protein